VINVIKHAPAQHRFRAELNLERILNDIP
jgi:hypothetical protein